MLKKLNRKNTASESDRPVRVLQFGEGNFLRAFVDWMIDVMNEKAGFNSDVQIVQPIRNGMGDMVNVQEGLYHVLLQGLSNGSEVNETRLITCVRGVINPYSDWAAYLRASENPDLQFIVSNTTEAGISFNEADTDPNVIPDGFPGKLTLFLLHRFKYFKGDKTKALIFLPCELIEKNGENLKACILHYIRHWKLGDDFKNWILNEQTFCNTLVDRIVTGYPKDNASEIQKNLGYDDNLLVKAEPFHLWVIEGGESVRQQIPLDKAGLDVVFTNDLTPYRSRKVRILNGAHTAMVPVAYLHGLRTVRESIEDSAVGSFVRRTIFEEIIPTLELPEKELKQFAEDVIERFRNPFIRHELMSIALNSISKFSVRVLPSFVTYHQKTKQLPAGLTRALAALIAFYRGTAGGETIALQDNDDALKHFKMAWEKTDIRETVTLALQNNYFQPYNLVELPGLVDAVAGELSTILQRNESPVKK